MNIIYQITLTAGSIMLSFMIGVALMSRYHKQLDEEKWQKVADILYKAYDKHRHHERACTIQDRLIKAMLKIEKILKP